MLITLHEALIITIMATITAVIIIAVVYGFGWVSLWINTKTESTTLKLLITWVIGVVIAWGVVCGVMLLSDILGWIFRAA